VRRGLTITLAAALLLAACGGDRRRALLPEYRLPRAGQGMARPVWLTSLAGDELGGSLSPDGRRLVYASDQDGNLDVWIKDLTSGTPRRLTRHVATDTQPAWSPDGKAVAFVSMRRDVKGDLFIWKGGKTRGLTGRDTADGHPAFSPDGRALFFAAGPEGRTRIERIELDSGRRRAVTGWGADHPAPSPDGRYLAYTLFDPAGRGRIAVSRPDGEEQRLVTSADFHAGFAAFSPDGSQLVYARFDSLPPGDPMKGEPPASLWSVDLQRALGAATPAAAQALATPLTSGRRTALFPRPHRAGLVFTGRQAGTLDVGLLPAGGAVPRLATPGEQLALALRQEHPRDQLLCLQKVTAGDRSNQEVSRARFLEASLRRDLRQPRRAARLYQRLVKESALRHGVYAQLAAIDLAVLPLTGREPPVPGAEIDGALARLDGLDLPADPQPVVAAHLLLRRGDVLRQGQRVADALAAYEALLARYPDQKGAAVEARYRLGKLMAPSNQPVQLSRYYLDLLRAYPAQRRWRRRAAGAVLALSRKHAASPTAELERLRVLVELPGVDPLFDAVARLRMATLLERAGEPELAIEALHALTGRASQNQDLGQEVAQAAFQLGRISLDLSEALRKGGKLSRALRFYDRALAAYETVMKRYPRGHEHHTRARRIFLRLALLDAAQRERQGELALAEKRYRRILAMAPDMLQPHRRLISIGVARGQREALRARYLARVGRSPTDAAGHYGLAYLDTLSEPVDEDALGRAEERLRRVIGLAPRSPFGHMTLGWVHEMRERLLGQRHRAHLEEAITLYERARALNDPKLDLQTEADLLVNLCNAFANLGNGWTQAHRFCARRHRLRIPFRQRQREAMFRLTFGRASTALDQHEAAARELEHALDLARALDDRGLEAQVAARLALTAHLRGDHQASNRHFARAEALLRRSGRGELLAGLLRSMAYNLALQGKAAEAGKMLQRAAKALGRHGVPAQEEISRIGPAGRTTAPFGFDADDERYLSLAIRGLNHRQGEAWPEVVSLLRRRVANRQKILEPRKDEELHRELGLLHSQLGVAELRLGRRAAFRRAAAAARKALARSTTEAVPLDLQLALGLNEAEELLTDAGAGLGAMDPVLQRLRQLDQRRERQARADGADPLPRRMRLALWTDLALLNLRCQRLRGAVAAPAGNISDAAQRAERTLRHLRDQTAASRQAVTLLRRVQAETAPDAAAEETDPAELEARGVLAPLHRPLSAAERARWHTLAGLNLALVAAGLTPPPRLADHPTTAALERLLPSTKGDLRHAVAAELAHRRRDLPAMKAAVSALLKAAPAWLLDPGYATRADTVRALVFGRAVDLALALDQPREALAFAEQRERRAFADDLWRLPLAGHGRAAAPVAALRQSWKAGDEARTRKSMTSLARVFPRVAGLLEAGPFPLVRVAASLDPDAVAISAVVAGDGGWVLVRLGPDAAVKMIRVQPTAGNAAAREARLGPALRRLAGQAARVYADLGRISPELSPERILTGKEVVRLATLWQLADAAPLARPAAPGLLVVDPDPRRAASLARLAGGKALSGAALTRSDLDLKLERAGALLWTGPLRHDGQSPANLRLLLRKGTGHRLEDLRLPHALGLALRGHVLALVTEAGSGVLASRPRRVALCRMAHAMGTPTLLLVSSRGAQKTLRRLLDSKDGRRLSARVASAGAPGGALQLMGYGGLASEAARALARRQLKKLAFAGAKAFNKKRLPEAVEKLERALLLMDHLGDEKYLDGTLLYLANSYTLLKDQARAVPMAERLLSTRTAAVKAAAAARERLAGAPGLKKAHKKLLTAQARRIKALMLMGWLRLRTEQYDMALEANAEAIKMYGAVGRPTRAIVAHRQRSTIADKKGDYATALASASEALRLSLLALKKARKKLGARVKVVDAALQVALRQRSRFSRLEEAMAAARLSLEQLDLLPATAQKKAAPRRLEALLELSRIKGAMGNYGEAVARARQAGRLAVEVGIRGRARALLEEVNNLFFLGAHGQALVAADEGVTLAARDRLRRLQFLNARGSILAALGRGEEALAAVDAALALARSLGKKREVAASHNNRGDALRLQARFAEARREFARALTLDRAEGYRFGEANDLANLGLVLGKLGDARGARKHLGKAAKLGRELDAARVECKALAGLAHLALASGRPADARKQVKRGLALSAGRALVSWRWRFLLLSARALRAQGQEARARAALRDGISLVEDRPPRTGRAPGAPDVDESEQDLYHELVDSLAGAGKAKEALAVSEQLRARDLADLVSRDAGRIPQEQAQGLARTVSARQGELAAARAAALRATTPRDREKALAAARQARAALAASRQTLAALSPWLPGLVMPGAPAADDLVALGRSVKGAQVVSYHPTRRRLVIWLLGGGDQLHMKTVPVTRERLTRLVARHRKAVTSYHDDGAEARALHRLLLAPVADRLSSERLLVVPAGPLHMVPFAALHDGKDYEVARRTISYLPSVASIGRFGADRPAAPAGGWLSFAWAGKGPRPLTFAAREAEALAEQYPDTRVVAGADATVANFLALAPAAAGIHVATHGKFNPRAPLSSTLALSGGDLSILKLLAVRLTADLVLLSACETGRGHPDGAWRAVGLHRAFMAAGARRVVSTTYRVSDLGSALLMKHLFRRLDRGPAEALRAAQLHLRRRYPHPAFWAGFRVDGAP